MCPVFFLLAVGVGCAPPGGPAGSLGLHARRLLVKPSVLGMALETSGQGEGQDLWDGTATCCLGRERGAARQASRLHGGCMPHCQAHKRDLPSVHCGMGGEMHTKCVWPLSSHKIFSVAKTRNKSCLS